MTLVREAAIERLPVADGSLILGPLRIATGRPGTSPAASGAPSTTAASASSTAATWSRQAPSSRWIRSLGASAIAIDASYGDDDVATHERAAQSERMDRRAAEGLHAADTALRSFRGVACSSFRAGSARAGNARSAASADRRQPVAGAKVQPTCSLRDSRGRRLAARASRCRAPRCCATTAWACPVRRAHILELRGAQRAPDTLHRPCCPPTVPASAW